MGCGMAFAFSKPIPHAAFAVKVLRRAALIFLFGFLMYWYPFVRHADAAWTLIPFSGTRVMGVLQRIALCYALAAFAVRYLTPRRLVSLSVLLLAGYWAILLAYGDPADPLSKLGNAGTHLDLIVFGQAHLYRRDGGFDPEGLLGTLPATVNVIAGYLAARYLSQAPDRRRAAQLMALAGMILACAAVAMNPAFPIAKKLWTSSFVLLTVGIDVVVLAGLAATLEDRPPNPAVRFFQVFGRNPLVIYLFSELLVTTVRQFEVTPGVDVYQSIGSLFQVAAPGALGSLLCAIAYTLICWLLGYALDRRSIVVKL
jgi:predicted acyltransferase